MKKIGTGVLIVFGLAILVWLNYALFTGKLIGLPPEVDIALHSDDEIEVVLRENESWLVMTPRRIEPTTGLIMYPEGERIIRSYAPISREVARQGYQVVFLSRRLEGEYSATEEQRRINAVMAAYPQIKRWAVGGHTWGGQIGAEYAANNPDRVAGIVLWAGRIEASADLSSSNLPVLMVYGTLDDENVDLISNQQPLLPGHTQWVAIEGGNRAQFGNYGPMAADVGAAIDSETQQGQAAAATVAFLSGLTD
jgi:hypothetical protein